jgi:hypothetical protein
MSTLRKYRIKVEERQNGDKYYTPQVGTPKLIGRRSVYLFTDWKNIISDGESSSTSSMTSSHKLKICGFPNLGWFIHEVKFMNHSNFI